MMKKAVAIRHIAFEDLGTLYPSLIRSGYTVTYLEAGLDDLDLAKDADLVISLGGPISVNSVEEFPFLLTETKLLEQRLIHDLPTLGICLGAQLIAKVLGKRIYPGEKEVGWAPIHLTQIGMDSVLQTLHKRPVMHWHGETFEMPSDAKLLASSARCENQAFQFGRNVLGLQFHPEITVANAERWYIGHYAEIQSTPGIGVKQLREDTLRFGEDLESMASTIWSKWLADLL